MSEPAALPAPPGLMELWEQSLIAVVDPSVLRRAAARPAPSFGSAAGVALLSGTAALAVALAHAFVSNPVFLQQLPSPAITTAVGMAGLGVYASLFLLLSVALYGAGNALGGKGEFERGLQAAAMISALAPLQMLCGWFPSAWIVPALIAGWVAAGALEGLFNANRGPARAVCAVLTAGALGLQFVGRTFVDRTRDAYAATQAMTSVETARVTGIAALQAAGAAAQAGEGPASAGLPPQPAASGLDLLRGGPSEDGEAAGPETSPAAATAANTAAQAMQASAAGMLDALTPMLNMLTTSKNLRPEQKTDIKELQGLMQDLKTDMAARKKMDNAVFQAKMRRYQVLLMKVMSYGPAPKGSH